MASTKLPRASYISSPNILHLYTVKSTLKVYYVLLQIQEDCETKNPSDTVGFKIKTEIDMHKM